MPKKTKIKFFVLLMLMIIGQSSFSQLNPPILKAKSPKVSIKDGQEGQTRYWNHLLKSKSPIVYNLAKNGLERNVTFYTDIDSITIKISSESSYQFSVIVNKTDTCTVVLTTKNHQYKRINDKNNEPDTLPFTLNKNKQIIVKGSINNSPQISFCFDLGARMVYLIGKGFDKTHKLDIDGLIEDESVTGLSTEKTSSSNNLQIGNISMTNISVCYIDEAGFLGNGGGLIGFNVFQNKILEIDFDNKLLLIHNKLPEKATSYSPIEFKQTTGGLYIPITISNGKKKSKGWYFFDTGADNALTFDSKFATREHLYNTMKKLGTAGIASSESRIINADILEVPEVFLANFKLENVPTLLANESNAEAEFEDGVIGIGLQSRFNFIIDYKHNKMYLKQSIYFTESFNTKNSATTLFFVIAILISVLIIGFFYFKSVKKKRNHQTANR